LAAYNDATWIRPQSKEDSMRDNPVVWFEIYVSDLSRSRRFYEDVLQTTLQAMESPLPDLEMLSFPMAMDKGGAAGALIKMADKPIGGSGTLVYFSCDDCGDEAARVEKAGGKLIKPKFSIGRYGHCALATDPDGNMFGLHSMR
jgi:predicted enzyme related to lactoylglutathione lyase